jgi:hypothetical protein
MIFKRMTLVLSGVIVLLLFLSTGCSVSTHSMKSPKYHVEFYKQDFEYSKQVSAEATTTKVLGIDWGRIFKWNKGNIDSDMKKGVPESSSQISFFRGGVGGTLVIDNFIAPVIGNVVSSRAASFALYKLMQKNPGYDVIMYPQFEQQKRGFPLIYTKTKIKVTARLGKIKK